MSCAFCNELLLPDGRVYTCFSCMKKHKIFNIKQMKYSNITIIYPISMEYYFAIYFDDGDIELCHNGIVIAGIPETAITPTNAIFKLKLYLACL